MAVGLKASAHVLNKHEVGLLAGFRAELTEAAGEGHTGAAVVLRERRVCEHAVELARLALFKNLRIFQRIPVFDGETGDIVEDHVHVADGPDSAVGVLPVEGEIIRVLALLFHILMRLNEKAAGAGGGIVNGIARHRLRELHKQAHYFGGRIELTTFLTGAVGEILDQVFVGSTKQVGELEVVVDQYELGLVEVIEQVFPLLIRYLGLAFDSVEVDVVFQNPGQGVVLVFDGGNCLVEHVADVVLEVLERRHLVAFFIHPTLLPAGAERHKEGVAIGGLVIE